MRFSGIHLTWEGFRNIWQNRFMAIASIGVLMSCLLSLRAVPVWYSSISIMLLI